MWGNTCIQEEHYMYIRISDGLEDHLVVICPVKQYFMWSGYCVPYMPYLTLWDKISQNLAHLEANSHKIFNSHRIFRPSYNTFYEEMNLHHTLLCLSQTSYIIIKAFDYFIQSDFCKTSLKNLPHPTDFSPQLMACMVCRAGKLHLFASHSKNLMLTSDLTTNFVHFVM